MRAKRKALKYIAPFGLGVALAAINAGLAALIPMLLSISAFAASAGRIQPKITAETLLAWPLFYAAAGFLIGIVIAMAYNLAAKLSGGIVVDLE